ncbi:DNA repair exonuclease [Bacillus luteolus]|uniref:DNA repair exonuclease n=1 Tax=Litchfieldia luteola TaxID=682179 RepID=A0ABR9QIM7_9BACI|nr:DNA repair exonuclease [Cytobacillus luteolus]MBE4908353.1 DNA repair exonuclease [Cytobacillus luteolus]MBP1943141.1 DNA repair exonuclease SbcCD nuclease subunit [Cytobacillus luteolus]
MSLSFSFIHAADIHLDSPLTGLEQYEGAPVDKIRSATREAFKNLIDTAINNEVSFIIIAGDLYDGDWKDYNTGLFFANQMVRLQKENIKVYLIRGNHDAASLITRELKLPDNVLEFSVKEAESYIDDDLRIAIHGQGFASRAVEENLVKNYPRRHEGYLNIGILHTSATGSEGHETYAPCSVEDMKGLGYDYWALGHIHLRELLHEKDPVILFPGNIQGRHIKETGDKGCSIVKVEEGMVDSVDHISLDVLRWELCEVDASEVESIDELMNAARELLEIKYQQVDGRFLAIRFRIYGSSKIHQELLISKEHVINNLRSIALDVGLGDIWVEKVKVETTRSVNIDELKEQNTPLAVILEFIKEARNNESMLDDLLSEFQDIGQTLPYELRNSEEGLNFNDSDSIKKRIEDVEDLILYYLTKTGVEV